MTTHLILGDQPNQDGTISPAYMHRIRDANERLTPEDIIIFTGGITVKDALSEALMGHQYMQSLNPKLDEQYTVKLEDQSRTTGQNFEKARKHLSADSTVHVYLGDAQVPKAQIAVDHYLPSATVAFYPSPDYRGVFYRWAQRNIGPIQVKLEIGGVKRLFEFGPLRRLFLK